MNRPAVTEHELHAYADDALAAARRADVEAYLAAHPDEMARVRSFREQNRLLRTAFAPVLDEPVPARLHAAALGAAMPEASGRSCSWLPRWSLQRVAAGFAVVLISAAAGWVARGQLASADAALRVASLPRQAAIAHAVFVPDVRRPVEIGAEQEAQLVTWLSKRMGSPMKAPKLGALGFELVGGRLLPGANGPVAQFMYQDASGQRLTLYVSSENTANRDTAFRFAQEGSLSVFYWIDGKFGYALSAAIGKGDLARVASAVYEQLEQH